MRSVVVAPSRPAILAVLLVLPATPLLFHTGPAARGDDKVPAKALPAELATVIRDGDLKAVRAQLDTGVDVNARDADGNTPLILAAVYAGPDCVELLLKKGADVNAKNKAGATALFRVATDYEKAKPLIDAGADIQVKTASGNSPVILAARKYGNSKTVKLLLDKGADAKERNKQGVSPIQVAAACGDLDSVKLLVEHGANVNEMPGPDLRTGGMRTPLGWAAYRNDVPMVRYLLERKADPNKATTWGTPLTFVAWHNSPLAAEVLLAHGAMVDIRDEFTGFTPLHWAAATDSPRADLVTLLLKHGADPNAPGGEKRDWYLSEPQTPRMLAEKRGRTANVEALAAAGAKAPPRIAGTPRPVKPVPDQPDAQRIRDSAESAVRMLQDSAAISSQSPLRHAALKRTCVSCHQHFLPLAAIGHAKDRAIRLDLAEAKKQIDDYYAFGLRSEIADFDIGIDPATSLGYRLFGMIANHSPPGAVTDIWVHRLAVIQQADGRWMMDTPRAPMQASDVPTTALAIQAIRQYGWAGRKGEFDAAVDRGRKWLWSVKAETTEEAAYQLLGLHWAGEPAEKLADLAKALLSQQRKDCGWAQLPTLESDAYATGQVLYALARAAKHPTTNPDWQQGLRYLLSTQLDDGFWHVVSRAIPFQPTMDSGFAHRRDGWISAAGTSWAVLAMTESLPLGKTTEKPAPIAKKAKETPPPATEKVDFAKKIQPLLERSCLACHGPDKQRSNFRVDSLAALLKGGISGSAAVVPEKSAQSPLIDYLNGRIEGMEMPPLPRRKQFAAFTKEEVELVRAWIEQGAVWPVGVVPGRPRTEKPR
jgi:ankyrin repeat protein